MTEFLDRAVERLRLLPAEMQDEVALMVLSLLGDDTCIYRLTAEEKAVLAHSRAQAARGEFATDEEVEAVWAKHGL